jgi:hypothetical protein
VLARNAVSADLYVGFATDVDICFLVNLLFAPVKTEEPLDLGFVGLRFFAMVDDERSSTLGRRDGIAR